MRLTNRWLILPALLTLAFALVACDDGDGDVGAATPADGAGETSTATPEDGGGDATPTGTATATGTPDGGGDRASQAVQLALDADIGSEATEDDIAAVAIDVEPDGEGLPPGTGVPAEGAAIFAEQCASCHGANGEGGEGPQLVIDDPGPFEVGEPKTIGNYWPYATTVYDYINRAMPFFAPGTLTSDQVYDLTAFLLAENQIIGQDETIDQDTLPQVEMPNRDHFKACWPDECRPDIGSAGPPPISTGTPAAEGTGSPTPPPSGEDYVPTPDGEGTESPTATATPSG